MSEPGTPLKTGDKVTITFTTFNGRYAGKTGTVTYVEERAGSSDYHIGVKIPGRGGGMMHINSRDVTLAG